MKTVQVVGILTRLATSKLAEGKGSVKQDLFPIVISYIVYYNKNYVYSCNAFALEK